MKTVNFNMVSNTKINKIGEDITARGGVITTDELELLQEFRTSFSIPAVKEARESREHIELIDFNRLTSLWQDYYSKMNDEQKNLLPLHPIYFFSSID